MRPFLAVVVFHPSVHILCFCLLIWLAVGCGADPSAAPNPSPAATPVQPPTTVPRPTLTPRPIPSPAPTATKGPAYAELVLRWDGATGIADVDDVMEIAGRLRNYTGIIDGYGNEIEITILYDPQQTTPEAIQRILLDFGYKTHRP
jgi:hypothetical protein